MAVCGDETDRIPTMVTEDFESYGLRQSCERSELSHLGEADPSSYWP